MKSAQRRGLSISLTINDGRMNLARVHGHDTYTPRRYLRVLQEQYDTRGSNEWA